MVMSVSRSSGLAQRKVSTERRKLKTAAAIAVSQINENVQPLENDQAKFGSCFAKKVSDDPTIKASSSAAKSIPKVESRRTASSRANRPNHEVAILEPHNTEVPTNSDSTQHPSTESAVRTFQIQPTAVGRSARAIIPSRDRPSSRDNPLGYKASWNRPDTASATSKIDTGMVLKGDSNGKRVIARNVVQEKKVSPPSDSSQTLEFSDSDSSHGHPKPKMPPRFAAKRTDVKRPPKRPAERDLGRLFRRKNAQKDSDPNLKIVGAAAQILSSSDNPSTVSIIDDAAPSAARKKRPASRSPSRSLRSSPTKHPADDHSSPTKHPADDHSSPSKRSADEGGATATDKVEELNGPAVHITETNGKETVSAASLEVKTTDDPEVSDEQHNWSRVASQVHTRRGQRRRQQKLQRAQTAAEIFEIPKADELRESDMQAVVKEKAFRPSRSQTDGSTKKQGTRPSRKQSGRTVGEVAVEEPHTEEKEEDAMQSSPEIVKPRRRILTRSRTKNNPREIPIDAAKTDDYLDLETSLGKDDEALPKRYIRKSVSDDESFRPVEPKKKTRKGRSKRKDAAKPQPPSSVEPKVNTFLGIPIDFGNENTQQSDETAAAVAAEEEPKQEESSKRPSILWGVFNWLKKDSAAETGKKSPPSSPDYGNVGIGKGVENHYQCDAAMSPASMTGVGAPKKTDVDVTTNSVSGVDSGPPTGVQRHSIASNSSVCSNYDRKIDTEGLVNEKPYYTINHDLLEHQNYWTTENLQNLCTKLGLQSSGHREELVNRLNDWNRDPRVLEHARRNGGTLTVPKSPNPLELRAGTCNFHSLPVRKQQVPRHWLKPLRGLSHRKRNVPILSQRQPSSPAMRTPISKKSNRVKPGLVFSPYNQVVTFNLHTDERQEKRKRIYEIAASVEPNENPTAELEGDRMWTLARRNLFENCYRVKAFGETPAWPLHGWPNDQFDGFQCLAGDPDLTEADPLFDAHHQFNDDGRGIGEEMNSLGFLKLVSPPGLHCSVEANSGTGDGEQLEQGETEAVHDLLPSRMNYLAPTPPRGLQRKPITTNEAFEGNSSTSSSSGSPPVDLELSVPRIR